MVEAIRFDGLCATCCEPMDRIEPGQLVTYHGEDGDRVARADCQGCVSKKRAAARKLGPDFDLVLLMDAVDVIRSVRQQVHQAHHHGAIEDCSMNTCTAAADVLRRARVIS